MSLDWDLKEIDAWQALCRVVDDEGEERLNPVTEVLIFAALAVGLQRITEKNIDQWELRIEMLSQMGRFLGTRIEGGRTERWNPGRKDLEAHIGLSTNVGPEKTLAQFRTRLVKQVELEARSALYHRAEKKKKKGA